MLIVDQNIAWKQKENFNKTNKSGRRRKKKGKNCDIIIQSKKESTMLPVYILDMSPISCKKLLSDLRMFNFHCFFPSEAFL